MTFCSRALFACLFVVASVTSAFAQDPVDQFIAQADSAATAGGDDALAEYVSHHAILVGAAVGLVLDVAFEVSLQGNTDGEKENLDFAERVAKAHAARNGSSTPLELVTTYKSWTPSQRKTKARAMALEAKAAEVRGANDPDSAVALYEQARALYEKIGDRRAIAVNWGSLGVSHWYRSDFDAVVAHYEKALEARRAIEDRILEGRTLNGLGSAWQQKGDYDRSARYYLQAIDLRRRTGDLGGLGTSLTYLGNTYYLSGRVVDARDRYEEALVILERLGSAGQMVDLLNGIASLYSDMGRHAAANETYRRAIAIAVDNDLPEREIPCRLNLADNLRQHARYGEALEQYARVEGLLGRHDEPLRRAQLLQGRGMTRLFTGDLDGARDDLVAGAKLAAALDDANLATSLQINIGMLYNELGAHERALEALKRANQMAIDAGDARGYRQSLVNIGGVQRVLGQHEEALAAYEEALAQDEHDGIAQLVVEDKVNVGMGRAVLGREDEARAVFYEALAEAGAVGSETRWWIHLGIGETFEDTNPDSAMFHYERALAQLEAARASLAGREAETGYLSGERRSIYEEVANYYATQSRSGEDEWSQRAFVTMERARARRLLDRMSAAVLNTTTDEEEKLLDAIYRLDPSDAAYADEEKRLRGELETLRTARARETFGALAEPTIATLADVRATLPKKTVALSYALGDTASLLWAINRDGVALFELPPRSRLEGEVERLRDAIARPGAGDATLLTLARAMYGQLLAPAEERLNGADRLLIMPDGFLFEVPFEALLTKDPEGTDWTKLPYVGSKYATLYAPSASVYIQLCNGEKRRYDLELVAYGAPDYSTLGDEGADLSSLPFAMEEVTTISDGVEEKKREVRVGVAATESAFKRDLRESSPRVVHLATHGLVDAAEPSASSVVLARDANTDDDGFLRAVEIASTPCDAGVVVMSACESARGRVTRGEGVIGLSQAFFASGADGVVASLWSVSDESTSELMQTFYKRLLGKKKSAAEAMKTARAELIGDERYAHPFYWSAFVVMGSDRMPW